MSRSEKQFRPDDSGSEAHDDALELSGAFGNFELIDFVGRDGPFAIYRARQTSLGRPVTLKVLVESPISIERAGLLRHEAEQANRLDHPRVIRVFETGCCGGIPFLVMAGIDGELLSERLKFGPLPSDLAVDLAMQLAETLAHAHEKGVIHGCLRPAAIWISADRHVRLGGFGQVIQYDAGDLAALETFAGYLAPEQAGSRGVVARNTDVYGLGAVLYAMLTGRPPHRGATIEETFQVIREGGPVEPSRIVPTVERELDIICSKCLHTNPAKRYGVDRPLARFVADLRRFKEGKPIRGDQSDLRDLARLFVRRNRRPIVASALILAGIAAPALWDVHRHRTAWRVLLAADATSSEYARAAMYFERRRLDRPDDAEALTALALLQLRAGRVDEAAALLASTSSWRPTIEDAQTERPITGDEKWARLQQILRLHVELRQGRWTEALPAIRGGHGKQFVARTPIEQQIFSECERLLDDESILIVAIRRGDRNAFAAAARRSPSAGLIDALSEKLAHGGELESRLRCIWLLSCFGKEAMTAEPVLIRSVTDFTPAVPRLSKDDPVTVWLGGRSRILFCLAPIKALEAMDSEWTARPEAKAIVPALIDSLAHEPNQAGIRDGLAEVIAALDRIDPNWMDSAAAAKHRAGWEAWLKLESFPGLQALGKQILQRLDVPRNRK